MFLGRLEPDPLLSWKTSFKISFLLASWGSMTKIAGSGSESGSKAWIRGSGSNPKCHGSGTLVYNYLTFSMSCCSCRRPNWVRLEAAVGGIKGVRAGWPRGAGEGGIRGAGDRWEGEGCTRGAGDKNSGEPEEEAVDKRRPNSGTTLLRWKLQR